MQSIAFLLFIAFLPSSLPASCCQALFLCSHCCWSELLISYSSHVDNNFQGLWSQHTLNKILELECCFGLVWFLETTLFFFLFLFFSFSFSFLFFSFFLFFFFFFSLDKQMLIKALQFQAQIRKVQSLVLGHKQVALLVSGRGCTCLCTRQHSRAVLSGQCFTFF